MTRLHTAPLVLASAGPKRPAGTQHPRATTGLQKAAIVGSTSGLGSRSGTDRHHPSRSREGRQGSDTGPGSPHVPAPHAQRAPEATCFQARGTQTLDPAAPQGGSGACGGPDRSLRGDRPWVWGLVGRPPSSAHLPVGWETHHVVPPRQLSPCERPQGSGRSPSFSMAIPFPGPAPGPWLSTHVDVSASHTGASSTHPSWMTVHLTSPRALNNITQRALLVCSLKPALPLLLLRQEKKDSIKMAPGWIHAFPDSSSTRFSPFLLLPTSPSAPAAHVWLRASDLALVPHRLLPLLMSGAGPVAYMWSTTADVYRETSKTLQSPRCPEPVSPGNVGICLRGAFVTTNEPMLLSDAVLNTTGSDLIRLPQCPLLLQGPIHLLPLLRPRGLLQYLRSSLYVMTSTRCEILVRRSVVCPATWFV